MTALATTTVSNEFISELAARLRPPSDICTQYGISPEQLAQLAAQDWFKARLKEARKAWEADANATERVKAKAALAAEDTLLDVVRIVRNAEQPASARLDAHKHLTKLAGMGEKEAGPAIGSGFSITINLGEKPVEITGSVIDPEAE